jgi:predicted dehydrogenase
MVAAAERAGVPLSIGMVRRRLAPVRMIRSLLDRNAIGDLQSIDIFEGGPFHWPVASPVYFDRHQGAGGVFEDVGTHVLDLLHWCLGAPSEIAFADDAMGGVAANCVATLTYGEAIATIRLSRDWHRPNQWLLRGTSGWMRWSLDDWERVEFAAGDYEVRAEMLAPEDAVTFEQAFAAQLSDFARSLRNGASDFVRGADALPVLETLERCAAVRTRMDMPWLA